MDSHDTFTLKDKLTEIHNDIKGFRSENNAAHEKLGKRVRSLEDHRASFVTIFKFVGVVIGLSGGVYLIMSLII